MTSATLHIQQLQYGHKAPLFEPLTFRCQRGEIWAVLGRNGLGKSTLLDTLSGVLKPLAGGFKSEGGVGIVAQHSHLPFPYTVRDVVLMGRARHVGLFSLPGRKDGKRITEALEQLNIGHLATQTFTSLSGGQQQLVMIARALVTASQTLLLDEPCSALDLANQQVVLQLISDLAHRQNRCIVFSTHDPVHAQQVATHTLLLLPGGKWLAGATGRILSEENMYRAYGLALRKISMADSSATYLVPHFTIDK
ncbi:ABC transporter ATP-binding protein [Cedecea colo]|uniref:ABC transporter ATP-binding protein n=1 Tax=Cedecea colo TaxID=2552946 RepID=A0ABX0VRX6_9ENTR|nr:ABC transporter ATP-binding protein [Cedecea colo]NIY49350.1 ABC transporter ATP-binding protein [Cedecea colo]